MTPRGYWLLLTIGAYGVARKAAASFVLRGDRCSRCATGHVAIVAHGPDDETTSVVDFRCPNCGLERVQFSPPVPDRWANVYAFGARPFVAGAPS